jgi:hypothetical protein
LADGFREPAVYVTRLRRKNILYPYMPRDIGVQKKISPQARNVNRWFLKTVP